MKPYLVSVVTAHVVYFCAFARSEILPKNTRELGMGRGQFHSGVNGLTLQNSGSRVKPVNSLFTSLRFQNIPLEHNLAKAKILITGY